MPGALAMARANTDPSAAAAVTLSGASAATTRGRPILCCGGLRPADRRRTVWRTRVAHFRIHESGPMVGPDLRPSSQPRSPGRVPRCGRAAEAERHGASAGEAETVWRNELAGLTLTMLLYLGGEPDLVRIVHPGEKPLKAKIARTDPERYRDLAEPTVQSVGRDFTRAIEQWENRASRR